MRIGRLLSLCAIAPLLLLGTTVVPTTAGPPGTWSKVSAGEVLNFADPSLYRSPDGVLHVVHWRRTTATTEGITDTQVSPSGTILRKVNVVSGWSSVDQNPRAISLPGGGVRVVFGGIRSTAPSEVYDGNQLYVSTLASSAGTWSAPEAISYVGGSPYISYGTGAVTLGDGTPLGGWALNNALTWHAGVVPLGAAGANSTYDFGACCTYYTTFVRSGSDVYAAWYANGSTAAKQGLFVKRIHPSVAATVKVPKSTVLFNGSQEGLSPSSPVALVARGSGGVFVAFCVGYPTCSYVGVWRVGTTTVVKVPGSKGATTAIAMASAANGRLWIAWVGGDKVHAVRTSPTGMQFGAVRTIGRPPTSSSLYRIAVDGTRGAADVVVNAAPALFHQQILPGLTLRAQPTRWPAQTVKTVTFTVLDAGAPVGSAKVTALSRGCTTNTSGTCTITFPKLSARRFVAVATKPGYAKGTQALRIG